jgi:hypothetical protein
MENRSAAAGVDLVLAACLTPADGALGTDLVVRRRADRRPVIDSHIKDVVVPEGNPVANVQNTDPWRWCAIDTKGWPSLTAGEQEESWTRACVERFNGQPTAAAWILRKQPDQPAIARGQPGDPVRDGYRQQPGNGAFHSRRPVRPVISHFRPSWAEKETKGFSLAPPSLIAYRITLGSVSF